MKKPWMGIVCVAVGLSAALVSCGQDKTGKSGKGTAPGADTGVTDSGGEGTNNGGTSGGTGPLPEAGLEVCGGGWCWASPTPYGSLLQAVHGAGSSVFIVGSGGTILQRTGGVWTGRAIPGTHFADVYAVSEDLAYAVGWATDARVTIRAYQWDGASWELFHTIEQDQVANRGALITPAAVWASETEVLVGGGPELHRFDGAWEKLSTPGDGPWMAGDEEWVADIACAADECFAVGQIGSHLRFAGDGFVWRLQDGAFVDEGLDVGALTAVDARADGTFVTAGVAGSSAVTAVRTDGVWEVGRDAPGAIADYVVSPSGVEWVSTTDFTFWFVHSRENGGMWTNRALPFRRPASLGPARTLPGLYASDSELFFVGRDDQQVGEIGKFDGSEWDVFQAEAAVTGEVIDLDLSTSTVGIVAGGAAHVWDLTSGDRQQFGFDGHSIFVAGERVFVAGNGVHEVLDTGLQSVSGAPSTVSAFFALSADAMFAADGADVYRSTGSTWTSEQIPEEFVEVRALWARAPDDAFAVTGMRSGAPTVPILWHFDGVEWAPVDGSPTTALSDVVLVGNASEVVVIGQEASSFNAFTYDGTMVSEEIAAGGRIIDASALPDGDYLAVTDVGDILRGRPGSWESEPKLAEQRLNTVATDEDGNAWVGGVAGTLLRTEP